jgi:hypothetical protein
MPKKILKSRKARAVKASASESNEIRDLAERLGVRKERVREAISIVGNQRADIKQFIKIHGR